MIESIGPIDAVLQRLQRELSDAEYRFVAYKIGAAMDAGIVPPEGRFVRVRIFTTHKRFHMDLSVVDPALLEVAAQHRPIG